jgi:hypothetical protein
MTWQYEYIIIMIIIFLWLCSPILVLGRLLETFRLISVTRSRKVGRIPWTGDQLVSSPLRVCPGWLWGWRSGWIERFRQGKPNHSGKTCSDATLSTTNSTCQTRARTRAAAVGSQRLTASDMARPVIIIIILLLIQSSSLFMYMFTLQPEGKL